VNVPVNLAGYAETLKAMDNFDNGLYKDMNANIKAVMLPIRDKARSYAPANSTLLTNWTSPSSSVETIKYRAFPKYDETETKRGIVYKEGNNFRKGKAFQVSHYVANRSAGGAIYETAGRKAGLGGNKNTESLNPNAGQQFMAQFASNTLVGKNRPLQGRLIYRAWSEDQGKAQGAVLKAIEAAILTFNMTNPNSLLGMAA
jgi:hypothetical protein